MAAPEELFKLPENLTLPSDEELAELETNAVAEFDRVNAIEDIDPETVQYQLRLSSDIDKLRAEGATRTDRHRREAEASRAELIKQREAAQAKVHGASADGGESGEAPISAAAAVDADAIAAAAVRGTISAMSAILSDRRGAGSDIARATERATASLSETRRHQPVQTAPRPNLPAITAGVDIPGIPHGGKLTDMDALVDAFHRRAKGMPTTNGMPSEQLVASIRNEFEHTVDERTSASQVDELLHFLTSDKKKDTLVAGGGWCAPSEVRYEFFNVAESDGMIDLPTIGITRGGIRFPTSPSIADAFIGVSVTGLGGFAQPFGVNSVPWLWTEASDIATVTGAPNKPCLRVPCPSFDEARLECYGICVTAGNLTDSAYPEATANFLRLVLAAHEHAMNGRFLSQMIALSSAAISTGGFAELNGAATQVLGGLALAATDYRAKYGMRRDAVLEVVAPYWLLDVIQADIAHRIYAENSLETTKANIQSYFADRNVRVQWVNDWQVRGASQFGSVAGAMTAWPVSADVLVYAAGTFVKGNGMTLDLGVVRDSTLNAENDHTAAWSEECHLIAKVGHESRRYTIAFNVSRIVPPPADTTAGNL